MARNINSINTELLGTNYVSMILIIFDQLYNFINPNWHEAGHFYPPCKFGIGFCQLNLLLGGVKDEHFSCFLSSCQLGLSDPANLIAL